MWTTWTWATAAIAVVVLAAAYWYYSQPTADPATNTATNPNNSAVTVVGTNNQIVPDQSTPSPTYTARVGADHFGDDLNGGKPFASVEEARAWCDLHPECAAYNNSGWVKSSATETNHYDGTTMYVKN